MMYFYSSNKVHGNSDTKSSSEEETIGFKRCFWCFEGREEILWVEYVNVGDGNVMRRGSYSELSVLVMLNEIDR